MNKAVGHDNIPAFFLHLAAATIAPSLQCFINFSFTHGTFSDNCTLTKVIPFHEKGNKSDPNNYRLFSILICFSKILKHLIYIRFLQFLKKYSVIHKSQYGFQKEISAAHAVLDLVTTSFDNINNNFYTCLLFLNLQKAFNTMSHEILLFKLDCYSIRSFAHKLMQLFFNRKQLVSINGINSVVECVTYGVVQGFTLGRLLFLAVY